MEENTLNKCLDKTQLASLQRILEYGWENVSDNDRDVAIELMCFICNTAKAGGSSCQSLTIQLSRKDKLLDTLFSVFLYPD